MNIVFDLGGVVFFWDPRRIVGEVFKDADIQKKVLDDIYHHQDWIELDRGTLDRNEAIHRASLRTGLDEVDILTMMKKVPEGLRLNPVMVDLIRRIRNSADHKLYILSNMHIASIDCLEKNYSIWDQFDGQVISCRVGMVKPEPDIYQYLLDHFRLEPSETIFIDDLSENLKAASEFDINTIQFESPEQLEKDLAKHIRL